MFDLDKEMRFVSVGIREVANARSRQSLVVVTIVV